MGEVGISCKSCTPFISFLKFLDPLELNSVLVQHTVLGTVVDMVSKSSKHDSALVML